MRQHAAHPVVPAPVPALVRALVLALAPAMVGMGSLAGCKVCTDAKPCVVANESAPPLAQDDTADCNVNVPVITAVTINNGGKETFDNGEYPTVGIQMDLEDDDGDLDVIGMNVWFDAVVDGAVDRSGQAVFNTDAFMFSDATACMKYMATLTLKPAVTGNILDYNTRYEFAVTGIDHHGVESSPFIADGVTPNSDGTDGTAP